MRGQPAAVCVPSSVAPLNRLQFGRFGRLRLALILRRARRLAAIRVAAIGVVFEPKLVGSAIRFRILLIDLFLHEMPPDLVARKTSMSKAAVYKWQSRLYRFSRRILAELSNSDETRRRP